MLRLAVPLACVLLTGPAVAASAAPLPAMSLYLSPQTSGHLPDGRRVNFVCMGQGRPVAIIEQGWGGVAFQWRHVQPEMAKTTTVCYFDRPGYGFSDPGPMPRDSAADVRDLHAALKAVGLAPPYVFVSSSLGGFNIRLYAYTYPSEVAGLEIEDPPAEQLYVHNPDPDEDVDDLRRCIALAKVHSLVDGGPEHCIDDTHFGPEWTPAIKARTFAFASKLPFLETLLSEDLSMVTSSTTEIIQARRTLGHIPLVILQADTDCDWQGRTPKTDGDRFDVARCAALANEATDSTRGERRIVDGSGHSVYDDRPDVVIATFREIVSSARATGLTAADR